MNYCSANITHRNHLSTSFHMDRHEDPIIVKLHVNIAREKKADHEQHAHRNTRENLDGKEKKKKTGTTAQQQNHVLQSRDRRKESGRGDTKK